jgi:uncharacterized membrane protein YccC
MYRATALLLSHPYARLALLASLSGVIAFWIGSLLGPGSGMVAAITALVSIRPTFHDSVLESVRQVGGTLLGAGTALALTYLLGGYSPLVLFGALLASYGVSRLLRLGDGGALSIAVTVVLVTGGNMDTTAVELRFLGVIIGVLIALLASLYTLAGTPTSRALDATLAHADRLATLLGDISDVLQQRASGGRRVPPSQVTDWLDDLDGIHRDLAVIEQDAQAAVDGAAWSPLLKRSEAEQVLTQVRLTQATCTLVTGMCRDLLIGAQDTQPLPRDLVHSLSGMFGSLSDVVSQQAETAKDSPAETIAEQAGPVVDFEEAAGAAVQNLKDIDATAPLLLGGSLLQDGEKISRLMTGRDA